MVWRALWDVNSILAREDRYEGFGVAQPFAKDFFGNPDTHVFEPFGGINPIGVDMPSEGFLSRFNLAAGLFLKVGVKKRGLWHQYPAFQVLRVYQRLCRNIRFARTDGFEQSHLSVIARGVVNLIEMIEHASDQASDESYLALFSSKPDERHQSFIHEVAEIVLEALNSVANDFKGVDDQAWLFALDIERAVFNRYSDVPAGLTPLQQSITIKLIDQLDQNMDGYYPTLSKVLLAIVGSYETTRQKSLARPQLC